MNEIKNGNCLWENALWFLGWANRKHCFWHDNHFLLFLLFWWSIFSIFVKRLKFTYSLFVSALFGRFHTASWHVYLEKNMLNVLAYVYLDFTIFLKTQTFMIVPLNVEKRKIVADIILNKMFMVIKRIKSRSKCKSSAKQV